MDLEQKSVWLITTHFLEVAGEAESDIPKAVKEPGGRQRGTGGKVGLGDICIKWKRILYLWKIWSSVI